MTNSDAVTIRGLCKSYGQRTVVDRLDLDVRAGEIVGLIGANGAGKTTTVECIQGLRRSDAGTIRVFGLDPLTDAERLRPLIGSQLQDSALPDRLRVGEAISLFNLRGADNGDALLEQFGLGQRRRSAFASLSGGERQRLALCLALLGHPQLVILDELTQGLDPAARRDVWRAVAQLRESGTTVLLVTHEVDEAEALCDRVIAMRAGRILDEGPPEELVDRHGRRATVRFTLPVSEPALELLEVLPTVAGVADVSCAGPRVTVTGDRSVIAHVGAALVNAGIVPSDLRAEVPHLQDALLELLDGSPPVVPVTVPTTLIGASR